MGKNPSLNEFYNRAAGHFNIGYRFPNWSGTNLTQVWDDYFRQNPLVQWFASYEPILRGLNCSYYQNTGLPNVALHTDICSPIATDPTWTKLNPNQRQLLFTQGLQIWKDLVIDLAPDVILVSIPRSLFLQNISGNFGQPIYKVTTKSNGVQERIDILFTNSI